MADIDFPKWVKRTPCENRSQTVVTRDEHGITSHRLSVNNRDLPMAFEKKMGTMIPSLRRRFADGKAS